MKSCRLVLACCLLVALIGGTNWFLAHLAQAQVPTLDQYPSNLGTNVGLDSTATAGGFMLDTVMDFVGGDSTDGSSTGLSVMHGYHFIDDEATNVAIVAINAVPEKRVPTLDNNSTNFRIEIYPSGADTTLIPPSWTSDGYPIPDTITSIEGTWSGRLEATVAAGLYDVYFQGLSFLKRRLSNVSLTATGSALSFTDPQATANDLPTTRLGYGLYSGDAAIAYDPDGSCAGNVINCAVYSGDEWGDNYINGLDLSAITPRLFVTNIPRIVKEDLNRDNLVNGLDQSIAQANLLKWGDR